MVQHDQSQGSKSGQTKISLSEVSPEPTGNAPTIIKLNAQDLEGVSGGPIAFAN